MQVSISSGDEPLYEETILPQRNLGEAMTSIITANSGSFTDAQQADLAAISEQISALSGPRLAQALTRGITVGDTTIILLVP